MQVKTILMDALSIDRALKRISHEIIENNKGVKNVVLLGIARGGVPISEKLAKNINEIEKLNIPTSKIDITYYRDDIIKNQDTDINLINKDICSIEGKDVVLVDDVLYTGRTVRAAIEAVFALGRPKSIQLAILIDRGHRELPIRADYVGKNVPTSKEEKVVVEMTVGNNSVYICK